mgnify:CR=1 FL=1
MKDIPQLNEHNKEEYPPMHTTEHILNQTMIRLFGCGRAVSAHIERKKSKLDFRFQREPEESEINQIEQQVNRIIQSGLPITTEYITQEEALGRFDLRRLPDNASETVRVAGSAQRGSPPCQCRARAPHSLRAPSRSKHHG